MGGGGFGVDVREGFVDCVCEWHFECVVSGRGVGCGWESYELEYFEVGVLKMFGYELPKIVAD